jgi:hypothetical protein
MKCFFIICLLLVFGQLSCKKSNGCKVKNTVTQLYDFQDSLYSPILFVWTNQEYQLNISHCDDNPNDLTIRYLNSSEQTISAIKTGGNLLEIPTQTIESNQWKTVWGNGTFINDQVFVDYKMTNFDDEEYHGIGYGNLK